MKSKTIAEFVKSVRPGTVVILRGVPGSGKSTMVEALKWHFLSQNIGVYKASADDHRMVDGKYVWTAGGNEGAHRGCLRDFVGWAQKPPTDRVLVVDNTNINPLEIAPYVALAAAYGYRPVVATLEVPAEVAAGRNVHGVPDRKVQDMAERLQRSTARLPSHWECVSIQGE